MRYEIISFDNISDDRAPSLDWCHKQFSPVIGEIIYLFFTKVDFDVFDEYKEIIRSIQNKKHLTQKEQVGLSKIKKQLWLKNDFAKNKKFYNPLVATPYKDNKYLVHPGRDRFVILKAFGYNEYEFLVCSDKEMERSNLEEIQSHHVQDTIIRFNQRNFSTVTNVDDTAFRKWI